MIIAISIIIGVIILGIVITVVIRKSKYGSDVTNLGKFQWVVDTKSQCDKPCGKGTSTIKYKCIDSETKNTVDDGLCPVDRPPSSEMCEIKPCPKWSVKNDGACNSPCGPGEKFVTYQCLDHENNPSENCPEKKPESVVKCEIKPCPKWVLSETGKCDKICGPGKRVDKYKCVDADGNIVSSSECDASKKETMEVDCNIGKCPEWRIVDPGVCNKKCGIGTKTVVRECYDVETNKKTSEDRCDPKFKKSMVTECIIKPCPPPEWVVDTKSECDKPCGTGERNVTYKCVDPTTKLKVDSVKCINPKPPTKESCNTHPCEWKESNVGVCSTKCGPGTSKITYKCVDPVSGVDITEKSCPPMGSKQPPTKPCNKGPCQWTFLTDCDKPCGPGKQSSKCVDSVTTSGVVKDVPNSYCNGDPPKKDCKIKDCKYVLDREDPCVADCKEIGGGPGTKKLFYKCSVDGTKSTLVDILQCSGLTKPVSTKVCDAGPIPACPSNMTWDQKQCKCVCKPYTCPIDKPSKDLSNCSCYCDLSKNNRTPPTQDHELDTTNCTWKCKDITCQKWQKKSGCSCVCKDKTTVCKESGKDVLNCLVKPYPDCSPYCRELTSVEKKLYKMNQTTCKIECDIGKPGEGTSWEDGYMVDVINGKCGSYQRYGGSYSFKTEGKWIVITNPNANSHTPFAWNNHNSFCIKSSSLPGWQTNGTFDKAGGKWVPAQVQGNKIYSHFDYGYGKTGSIQVLWGVAAKAYIDGQKPSSFN